MKTNIFNRMIMKTFTMNINKFSLNQMIIIHIKFNNKLSNNRFKAKVIRYKLHKMVKNKIS